VATRDDVARLAGVAASTVSLVLNGRGDQVKMSQATQQRIRDAARRLKYIPNAAARALAGGRSRTIGLLMNSPEVSLTAPVFATTVVAAVSAARDAGYFVLLLPAPTHTDAPFDAAAALRDVSIAGLICEARGASRLVGSALANSGLPIVWTHQDLMPDTDLAGTAISIEQSAGVVDLARHLLERGRRSVTIIAPKLQGPDLPRYRPLLENDALATRIVTCAGWSSDAGRAAMRDILASGALPDAVFGGNDAIAAGAMHACRDHGLSIPDDIAVSGFGGFPLGRDLDPPLTTVAWPLDELGRSAVETLLLKINGKDVSDVQSLPTTLVVRAST